MPVRLLRYEEPPVPFSLSGVRFKGLREAADVCSLFWSKRVNKSLTLVCCGFEGPFKAGVDFAVLSGILSSTGVEADRYAGLKAIRDADIEGCFGVVPLLFEREEDEGMRDPAIAGVAVIIPFVVMSL